MSAASGNELWEPTVHYFSFVRNPNCLLVTVSLSFDYSHRRAAITDEDTPENWNQSLYPNYKPNVCFLSSVSLFGLLRELYLVNTSIDSIFDAIDLRESNRFPEIKNVNGRIYKPGSVE